MIAPNVKEAVNPPHLARQHAKKFNHTVNVELGFHKRIVGDEK